MMYQWLQRLLTGSSASSTEKQPFHGGGDVACVAEPALPKAADAPAHSRAILGSGIPFDQADQVNRAWNEWAFANQSATTFELSENEQTVLATLRRILESQQSGAALVRRMPGLIPQLLQSLRSDDFSGAQLSRTISGDVVLVAAVIRLANNAMRGTGKTIASVEHAVMVLGQEGLRQLITSVAFRPIIDMNSGYYTRTLAPRIWERAERCANANRALAADHGADPFDAFLAALVQNVGMIVALRIMDQLAKDDRSLGSELFCAELASVARGLSASISHEWHFPQAVTHAIREQGGVAKGMVMSPLGRLMALSDYLGKARQLVEAGAMSEHDPAVFTRLPEAAMPCYQALEPMDDL